MNLPTINDMRNALAIKNSRKPVSMTKGGRIKASGKASARNVAIIRRINVERANRK